MTGDNMRPWTQRDDGEVAGVHSGAVHAHLVEQYGDFGERELLLPRDEFERHLLIAGRAGHSVSPPKILTIRPPTTPPAANTAANAFVA